MTLQNRCPKVHHYGNHVPSGAEREVFLGSCEWNSIRGCPTPFSLLAQPSSHFDHVRLRGECQREQKSKFLQSLLLLGQMYRKTGRASISTCGPVRALFPSRGALATFLRVPEYTSRTAERRWQAPPDNGAALVVWPGQARFKSKLTIGSATHCLDFR
jgi:hypothetical protein